MVNAELRNGSDEAGRHDSGGRKPAADDCGMGQHQGVGL